MHELDDTTALALAASRGDRSALSDFIRSTQSDVWLFLARTAGPEQADDLTQETFLRMLGSLPRFEGRSSARTWLLTIARRVAVDRVRHDLARPRLVSSNWEREADSRCVQPDTGSALHATDLLDRLADDRREALVLTQLLGFSYAECAEICGCPVGTVRSRVARARAELVALLTTDADAGVAVR